MEEKIINVLRDVNEDLLSYEGNNIIQDGIVNSFTFISMLGKLEEEFDIEIDEDLLESEYFGNKDRIISTIKAILEGQL